MGVLHDYFIAPNDASAAATINWAGGPGRHISPPAKRGPFGWRKVESEPSGVAAPFPTVADTGIDPVVQGGTLEELLTGRPYEQIEQDPRWANVLADRDGGQGLVLTLTDGLIGALAQANTEQLARVAVPWSATEEFLGQGDPEALTSLLGDLSMLARDARARGESVYCWVSL
jgi:hypothetical protein